MKKFLLTFLMLIAAVPLWAYDFEVDGIYYNIIDETNKTVEVTNDRSEPGGIGFDESGNEIYYSHCYWRAVSIPSEVSYNGTSYSVTSIKSSAFEYCISLPSITIPNSVTSIGDAAFNGCTGLTEVNITDLSAWYKINFGNSNANPLHYAHHLKLNGTEVTNLVIPNDITEIKQYAFDGCTGLTSVAIPNSVTSIGEYAFKSCTGLTSVTIPNSVTTII